MPACDQPLHVRVPRQQQVAVGAVIQFKSIDVERIQAWLDRAAAAGIIEQTTAHEYNPEYGGPVWYIP